MKFLSKLFSIKGRLNRKKYIIGNLLSLLILIIAVLIFYGLRDSFEYILQIALIIIVPVRVYLFVITAKRLHDLNLPTWLVFIVSLIPHTFIGGPVIFALITIFLCCKQGTNGDNKYGPDPIYKNMETPSLKQIN